MDKLSKNQPITNGPLVSLTPWRDESGVMRVGGRLREAFMTLNEKHKVILPKMRKPKKSDEGNARDMTRKIIEWAHLSALHGGEQKTIAVLRQKFHIPNERNAVRYALHRCVVCRTVAAESHKQLMGSIPKESLMPAPPFFHTTLDYAGPFNIQHGHGRKTRNKDGETISKVHAKAWIAVFVCRLTGGCHLELVQNCTTKAFIEAFKRFVSTRGLPKSVMSDNASTFKKAAKTLKEDEKKALQISKAEIENAHKEIQEMYAFKKVQIITNEEGFQWKFLPPLSPDFGGKHEACVKQIKITLKKTIGLHVLPIMNFMTYVKQAEAMYNSRPLCIARGTPYEQDMVLTPAHFWLGRPLTAFPEPEYKEETNLAKWFDLQQRMLAQTWKTFENFVLHQLQNRPKWTAVEENIQIGEIVLLKEDNTPPLTWRKAVVISVNPGQDGLVRVVTVRDATNTEFKRSIRKVVRLPVVVGREEIRHLSFQSQS
jgi:Family of unknown function (DUF5641)/Integrase zinc binding domain